MKIQNDKISMFGEVVYESGLYLQFSQAEIRTLKQSCAILEKATELIENEFTKRGYIGSDYGLEFDEGVAWIYLKSLLERNEKTWIEF